MVKGCQRPRDTASAGLTGNTVLQAYRLDSTHLWTISIGRNILEGEHDTQFMVDDLDGDGRAEVAVRTADGTVDGTGKAIGDPDADWRQEAVFRTPDNSALRINTTTDPTETRIYTLMHDPQDRLSVARLARPSLPPRHEPW